MLRVPSAPFGWQERLELAGRGSSACWGRDGVPPPCIPPTWQLSGAGGRFDIQADSSRRCPVEVDPLEGLQPPPVRFGGRGAWVTLRMRMVKGWDESCGRERARFDFFF